MDIELKKANIEKDIRMKSHLNVKSVEGIDLRYDIEVGTDKDAELQRCISSMIASLTHIVSRWLRPTWEQSKDDSSITLDTFVYSLSSRRGANKAEALATTMHDYVVYGSMANFYTSVAQQELANVYNTKAAGCELLLNNMLNSKIPPRR